MLVVKIDLLNLRDTKMPSTRCTRGMLTSPLQAYSILRAISKCHTPWEPSNKGGREQDYREF